MTDHHEPRLERSAHAASDTDAEEVEAAALAGRLRPRACGALGLAGRRGRVLGIPRAAVSALETGRRR